MARLVVQADIDAYNAAIVADGQPPMQLNDYLILLSDKNASGNVFHDGACAGMREGGTIWIESGSYGAIQLGENFNHSDVSINDGAASFGVGGSITLHAPTGLTLPIGHTMRCRILGDGGKNFVGTISSYAGNALVLNNIINVTDLADIASYDTTSATNINLSTASDPLVITVGTGLPYIVGNKVQLISASAPTNRLKGTITAYNSSTGSMTLDPIVKEGTATLSDWNVNVVFETVVELARSSDANRVHVRGFNGRVDLDYNGTRSDAFAIWNINYLVVDFETNTYPGLRDGWGSGRSGTFGFKFQSVDHSTSDMGFKIDNALGTAKKVHVRGCEMSKGGFAIFRFALSINYYDEFLIERNILDRSMRGEGIYQSLTTSGPWPLNKGLKFRNNIIAFTAAEAIQLQQCGDGTIVENNVVFVADHDYRSAFQGDQDTAVQLDMSQGNVIFRNNIVYSFGKLGLHLFGKNMAGQGYPFGAGVPKMINNAFSGTKRQMTIRVHNSLDQDFCDKIVFRDNDITKALRIYTDVGSNNNQHSEMDGDVPIEMIGGSVPDDIYPIVSVGTESGTTHFNILRGAQPDPEFVNSGFDGIDTDRITKWHIEYTVGIYFASSATSVNPATLTDGGSVSLTLNTSNGGYAAGNNVYVYSRAGGKSFYATVVSYSGSTLSLNNISSRVGSGAATDWNVAKRISYTLNDCVWLMQDGTSLPVALYKCKSAHDAHANFRPDLDATRWEKVWWDANGKNQYDPLYNGTPFTDNYLEAAGDFRLVKGSYHHLKGRGLQCNEQREDQTMMGWQWKQTDAGTVRDIPGAYTDKLRISDYSYLTSGRYYRFWVEKRKSDGTFEPRIYSAWNLIA